MSGWERGQRHNTMLAAMRGCTVRHAAATCSRRIRATARRAEPLAGRTTRASGSVRAPPGARRARGGTRDLSKDALLSARPGTHAASMAQRQWGPGRPGLAPAATQARGRPLPGHGSDCRDSRPRASRGRQIRSRWPAGPDGFESRRRGPQLDTPGPAYFRPLRRASASLPIRLEEHRGLQRQGADRSLGKRRQAARLQRE